MEKRSDKMMTRKRDKISTGQEWQMERIRKKHGVTDEEIKAAIKAVGDQREDVEAFLKENRSTDTLGNP